MSAVFRQKQIVVVAVAVATAHFLHFLRTRVTVRTVVLVRDVTAGRINGNAGHIAVQRRFDVLFRLRMSVEISTRVLLIRIHGDRLCGGR